MKVKLQSVLQSRNAGSATYPGPRLRHKGLDLAGTPRRTPPAGDSAPRGPRPPSWTAGLRTPGRDKWAEGNTEEPAAQKNSPVSATGEFALVLFFFSWSYFASERAQ